MANINMDHIRSLMGTPTNIRNVCVVASHDHGKSTLTDLLLSAAGIVSSTATSHVDVDEHVAETLRPTITIKSKSAPVLYRIPENESLPGDAATGNRDFLINLVDSPGHVDFSSEVTPALRACDGALVVVDCVEGVVIHTETVLRQALAERTIPVVAINKLDRTFLELQLQPEEMFQCFQRVIDNVNAVNATYQDPSVPNHKVSPDNGTVAFCSGLHGWAFTVDQFARMYSAKFGMDEGMLVERLWGDNFFNAEERKWHKHAEGGERAFCELILKPLQKVIEMAMNGKIQELETMLASMGVMLADEDRQLQGKYLVDRVLRKWLPAEQALLRMLVHRLPSPVCAQKYRVDALYQGLMDDVAATAIRNCDPGGPLMIYVSKLMPQTDTGRFIAFGRVFSGTAKTAGHVRVMGSNYVPGEKLDLYVGNLKQLLLMMGSKTEPIETVSCGNIIGITGIDQFLIKSGTLTDLENACPIKGMKYSVSPVMFVTVDPVNLPDLPKFIEALKKLVKSDPLVHCSITECGEHVVAGGGDLHLETCIQGLQDDFLDGVPIKISAPEVYYRETVAGIEDARQNGVCLSKSPNKHNRLFIYAEPFPEGLARAIEENKISPVDNFKQRAKILASDYGFEQEVARKIWAFGPDTVGPNLFMDATKGVLYLDEIKDFVVAAFQWVTKEGVICEENMRGLSFYFYDCVMVADSIHRGAGQYIPAARRAMMGAQIMADPRLMEPIYLVQIQCTKSAVQGTQEVLGRRRGRVLKESQHPEIPLWNIEGYLPVSESFGFVADLRSSTMGQAFPQSVFDHWSLMDGAPFVRDERIIGLVSRIRERKGLKTELPDLDQFLDRL
eukprot:CAMPEP_0184695842 /NCGR_PEP_ID=MMETSP0313-20130426/3346_1 /TAXON_ID=2792 /ORGANISM="Porphyridium aerugineum, Strain SAG 1380-2" /LENGTH=842 /DNA_ID=CAMNT_0027154369 /DNA_START=119 /DNA_END=2647 /DNA_ORIENTATION=-